MTLDEYTAFICTKVGQTDDLSRQVCADYVRARYRLVWDALLWRDTRCLAPVTATAAAVPLPDTIERVVSVRLLPDDEDGHGTGRTGACLDPIDDAALLAAFPGLTGQTGRPRCYEEFLDADGVRKLRLYPAPTPECPAVLLLAGKQPFPGLADGNAVPVLRNIDNVLLTFATGDMLERQRQYGKAQAKFEEGAAHLAAMVELETRQLGQIVQLVPA